MKLNLPIAFALVAVPLAAQAAEKPISIVAAENFYGEVASAIGRPSSTGVLDAGGWYYVQSRWRQFAWRETERIGAAGAEVQLDE